MITRPGVRELTLLALVLAGAATPASAQRFKLVMGGALDARSSLIAGGTTTALAGPSPFTLTAFFDTRSPNLAAPVHVPGFVAYTPTSLWLTLAGRTYAIQGFDAMHPAGVSVAIFDATTPFGPPGRYGVGLISDPLADGAGFVADYAGATPPFTVASGGVVPTTFTGYSGVGVSGGVCIVGSGGECQEHAVSPIPLTWSGQAFALVLGNYSEDAGPDAPTYTARISAVPEPSTLALLAAPALAGVALVRRKRQG